MGVIDSPEKLWYTLAGVLLMWLGKLVVSRVKTSVDEARERVDRHAATETENRKLKESIHEHRVLMIQSGQWTHATLPPFLKE